MSACATSAFALSGWMLICATLMLLLLVARGMRDADGAGMHDLRLPLVFAAGPVLTDIAYVVALVNQLA
eukprot:scaffold171559_cov34-Tisochrysis_lutea.AAC.4